MFAHRCHHHSCQQPPSDVITSVHQMSLLVAVVPQCPADGIIAAAGHVHQRTLLADTAALAAVEWGRVVGVENLAAVLVTMHVTLHACACLVGHGIGLQMSLDGGREGQLLDTVDSRVVHDDFTTQLLEAQN